jgi:hypothetical protein
MLFRVIRVHDWSTYDGWAWLDGYELNSSGDAVDRRSIFVQVGGLQRAHVTVQSRLGGLTPATNRPSGRPVIGQATRNDPVGTTVNARSSVAAASGPRRHQVDAAR